MANKVILERPDISYIVSLCNRPAYLKVCLAMLQLQSHKDFEVIITDNSTDRIVIQQHKLLVLRLKDARFKYLNTAKKIKVNDCYYAAEYGVASTTGRWLCFPCEDTYYPPEWGQRMLTAAYRDNLDLVICDQIIFGPETTSTQKYSLVTNGDLRFTGCKTSFIIKADSFSGWKNKPIIPGASAADRATLQSLRDNPAIRWGAVRDLFYFHN